MSKNGNSQICNPGTTVLVTLSGSDPNLVVDGTECSGNPWVLQFDDEFEGTSLDLNKWKEPVQQGSTATGASYQYYTFNNIAVSGGTCKIIAKNSPGVIKPAIAYRPDGDILDDGIVNYPRAYQYTSSMMISNYQFGYGKYEIRCKIPKGKGFFPAFWMYGNDGSRANEIDDFEFWNEKTLGIYDPAKNSKIVKMHYHDWQIFSTGQTDNDCGESIGNATSTDYSQDFHTFTIIYNRFEIKWYIDGAFIKETAQWYASPSSTEIPITCSALFSAFELVARRNDHYPKQMPLNIILNLAIQNGDNSPNSATPFPSNFEIDYVRFYKPAPCVGDMTYADNTSLGLLSPLYHYIEGNNIVLVNSINIATNQQLSIKACTSIILYPGVTFEEGSSVELVADSYAGCCNRTMQANNTDSISTITSNITEPKSSETDEKNIVNIIPNPNSGIFRVESTNGNQNIKEIKIFDIYGKLIIDLKKNESLENINLSLYSKGVFYIQIIMENNQQQIKKIIYN